MMDQVAEESQLPITDQDVRDIVRLLGEVAGMTTPAADRRRALMQKLAQFLEIDAWMWMHTGGWAVDQPLPVSVIDGGMTEDERKKQDEWWVYETDLALSLRVVFLLESVRILPRHTFRGSAEA